MAKYLSKVITNKNLLHIIQEYSEKEHLYSEELIIRTVDIRDSLENHYFYKNFCYNRGILFWFIIPKRSTYLSIF